MKRKVCVFLLTLALASLSLVSGELDKSNSRVIKLNEGGSIRGYKVKDTNYFAFHGIPYATAPTGPNRFKPPLPPPVWFDTLDATNDLIICPQSPLTRELINKSETVTETENCLIANVFVPETKDSIPLSVVVYIHGGAYQMGYGNMMIHSPLIKSGKIIEVNFNYRLGAHGFLCLGTEDVPGNAGLKDQVAALRWVKQNIAAFGGNPEDVTIAGFSAGASAVELLMLSESASGLFNKAIPESGAGIAVWSTQIDPLNTAKEYAKVLNFDNIDDIYALEEFYKTAPLKSLLADPFIYRKDSIFVFVPCVERVKNKESVLTEAPIDILKRGTFNQVPILIGLSNMEGMFRLPLFEVWKEEMNNEFSNFLPADLKLSDAKEKNEIAKGIREFYFDDKQIDNTTVIKFVEYFTDILFAYPIIKSAKLNVKSGSDSVYFYIYSYVDKNRPSPYNINGADHCAQSIAISENIFLQSDEKISDEYAKVKQNMADIWLNFITKGKPVINETEDFPSGWPSLSLKDMTYAELNVECKIRKHLFQKRMAFWDGIYTKYYRTPSAPPEPTKMKTEF